MVGNILCLDGRDSRGNISFLDCTVTDNDNVVQHHGAFSHGNVNFCLVANENFDSVITNAGENQRFFCRGFQRKLAVDAGTGASCGSFNDYTGTNDRQTSVIDYNTGYFLLCRCSVCLKRFFFQVNFLALDFIDNRRAREQFLQSCLQRDARYLKGYELIRIHGWAGMHKGIPRL